MEPIVSDTSSTTQTSTDPAPDTATAAEPVTAPLAEFAPGGPRADTATVALTGIGAECVVLGRYPGGGVTVYLPSETLPRTFADDLPATAITDTVRCAALLRQALAARLATETARRDDITATRHRAQDTAARMRSYAIARFQENQINRDELDAALTEFDLEPYTPDVLVTFTITGTCRITDTDRDSARQHARDALAVIARGQDNSGATSGDSHPAHHGDGHAVHDVEFDLAIVSTTWITGDTH